MKYNCKENESRQIVLTVHSIKNLFIDSYSSPVRILVT